MDSLATDFRFSIVPQWILESPISDKAVRVYAILARYVDNDTLTAFPSRDTLAHKAQCHVKSVDRAIAELEKIQAVTKTHRRNGESYASNLYTLRRVPPGGRDTTVATLGTPVSPGRDTDVHLTITKELDTKNIDKAFDEFWNVYPKKADKGLARKSFAKALKRASLEEIVSGAERYRDDPKRNPEFTKNPSTWLNADAWENMPAEDNRKRAEVPGARDWVAQLHEIDEHFACRRGEFGCK